MSKIHIKRRHRVPREELRERVERLAQDLKAKLNADYAWKGDSLQFKRSGASGSIDIADDAIELNIKLGLMLSPMKGKIEESIKKNLDLALNDKTGGGSAA
jgi:putative polyhydroxyalkanoate system protein